MFGGGIHNKNLPLIKFLCEIMIGNENLVTKVPSRPLKLEIFSKSSELVALNSTSFVFIL